MRSAPGTAAELLLQTTKLAIASTANMKLNAFLENFIFFLLL